MSTAPPPPYESVVDEDRKSDPNNADATQTLLEKEKSDIMTTVGDVEAQQLPRSPTESESGSGKHAAEYRVPTRTKYMYLGVYFGLNLGLTLFNKAILGKVRAFRARSSLRPRVHQREKGESQITEKLTCVAFIHQFAFPWLLTSIHTSTAAIGCSILLWRGHFHLSKLSTRENIILLGFSFLYTVNIAISNVSL